MKFKKLFASMVPAGLAVVTLSAPAFAAITPCSPTNITWNTVNGGQVQITCANDANTYTAITNAPGCAAQGTDQVKAMLSLAQAALLSGKALTFVESIPSGCGNTHVITQMVLTK